MHQTEYLWSKELRVFASFPTAFFTYSNMNTCTNNWAKFYLSSLTLSQTNWCFNCLQFKSLEKTLRKVEISRSKHFLLFQQCFLIYWRIFDHFYMPVKDGTYYGTTPGRRAGGRCLNSLSRAYLQDYASFSYEISWVDRSHQGECRAHEP